VPSPPSSLPACPAQTKAGKHGMTGKRQSLKCSTLNS
jgi:hypothetical protein